MIALEKKNKGNCISWENVLVDKPEISPSVIVSDLSSRCRRRGKERGIRSGKTFGWSLPTYGVVETI